jgi:RNA polymerase sigma-70 factor (ECF subfamily)
MDGPFAETKEQLLGFWIIDAHRSKTPSRPRAGLPVTSRLARSKSARWRCVTRERRDVNDIDDHRWIDLALKTARPQALGALLRYFRDLDIAEEAFQEACLRALTNWPLKGRPRDPVAWLIWVGRNAALDDLRRRKTMEALPHDFAAPAVSTDTEVAERLDQSAYRDDILRLLFTCCHPDLPAEQQIALALRIISGLSGVEIARVSHQRSAAEQRITRQRRIADAGLPFERPAARAERVTAVGAMIYLFFNEGYSGSGGALRGLPLCEKRFGWHVCSCGFFPKTAR